MGGQSERAAAILDAAQRQTYHEDHDGTIKLNSFQDVEPHLEYAAKCRRVDSETRGAFGKRGDMRRTMSVPFNVMLLVAQRLGIPAGQIFQKEHSQRIMRELKGSEFKGFRTTIDTRL